MQNENKSKKCLLLTSPSNQSSDNVIAGGHSDVTGNGEATPLSRSVHSGSSNSVLSDEMCSVLCENFKLNGYATPLRTDNNNKEDHSHSCLHSHMSVEDETVSHFIHLSHKKKMSSSMSRLDRTPPRMGRRNTIGCSKSVCVSCESLSNLNLDSPSPKMIINNVRHTKSSITRRQMAHISHGKIDEDATEEYLTPLQRKERVIAELRHDLFVARHAVNDMEAKLTNEHESREQAIKTAGTEKDQEIQLLREVVEDLRTTIATVTSSHQAGEERTKQLQEQVQKLQEEIRQNEERNQEMFLKMFIKGQKSAKLERQLQIEEIASANPVAVDSKELVEKLELTQAQLDRWQLLKRQESYDEVTIPGTDVEIKLRFMRDSLFHYLTGSGGNTDDHLKALIKVADFSNVQMEKIHKAISKKKKFIY